MDSLSQELRPSVTGSYWHDIHSYTPVFQMHRCTIAVSIVSPWASFFIKIAHLLARRERHIDLKLWNKSMHLQRGSSNVWSNIAKVLCVWKKDETGRSLAQGAIRNGVGGSCGPLRYTSCINSRPPHNPMNSKAPHLLDAGESWVHVGLCHQFKKSLDFLDCFNVLISWALFLCCLWFSTFTFILCHCYKGESIPELNGSFVVQLLWGRKSDANKTKRNKIFFFFFCFFLI